MKFETQQFIKIFLIIIKNIFYYLGKCILSIFFFIFWIFTIFLHFVMIFYILLLIIGNWIWHDGWYFEFLSYDCFSYTYMIYIIFHLCLTMSFLIYLLCYFTQRLKHQILLSIFGFLGLVITSYNLISKLKKKLILKLKK